MIVPVGDDIRDKQTKPKHTSTKQTVQFLGGHYQPIDGTTRLILAAIGLGLLLAAVAFIYSFDRGAPIRMRSMISSALLLGLALILLLVAATGHTIDVDATLQQQKEGKPKKRER